MRNVVWIDFNFCCQAQGGSNTNPMIAATPVCTLWAGRSEFLFGCGCVLCMSHLKRRLIAVPHSPMHTHC